MNKSLVYGITLNWNRPVDTIKCLHSLQQSKYPNLRLLVVDNGSTDGSPTLIQEQFPSIKQIINSSNLGFAGGFNRGIRFALEAGADYVLIVNNDTFVAPDMLDTLIEYMASNSIGVVSPLIYYADSPNQIWSAGAGRNHLTLELTKNHGRDQIYTDVEEREFLSGCGLLINKAVLEQVGLFDERFFMYYEDSDFSLRVRQAGFRMLLVPQAHMWHSVSRSSEGSDSANERYWMGKSSVLFYRKHICGWRWFLIIPWRLGSTIKNILRLLRKKKLEAARAYLRGSYEGLLVRDK